MRRCAAQRLQRPSSPITSPPPGLRTRAISLIACSASRTKQSTVTATTTSKVASPKGRSRAAPSTTECRTQFFIFCANTGGCNHGRVGIERRHGCALPRQFEGHCAIAATDIEQLLAVHPAEKSREQLPLKAVSDPAETARSPPDVRPGQSSAACPAPMPRSASRVMMRP